MLPSQLKNDVFGRINYATLTDCQYQGICSLPNGPELSRPRVKRRTQQSPKRHITKTGNNGALDLWVGSSESLCEKSDFTGFNGPAPHSLRSQPDFTGIDPCFKTYSDIFLPPLIFLLTFHTAWRDVMRRAIFETPHLSFPS